MLKLAGVIVGVPSFEAATLSTVLTDATTFITKSLEWLGSVMTVIMDNPIILIPFYILFAGLVWGLARRALNVMK